MKTMIKTTIPVLLLCFFSCTKENVNTPSAAKAEDESASVQAFTIGQKYGGGIIFYIDASGQHGLIAAPADIVNNISWYKGTYIKTGATGKGIGTGNANTTKIVNVQGKPGPYAALTCLNYKRGGFTDWYLPSKAELNQLYKKRNIVGGFSATNYWSSTEADANNAWDQEFGGGFQFTDDKSFTIRVRPIRAF